MSTMSKIIYGSEVAASIKEELKQEISLIKGRLPKLCVVLVGNNPASLSYVKGKEKATLIHPVYRQRGSIASR